MAHSPIEQVRVLFLNAKNMLIANEAMWRGSVDEASVHVREVIARAIALGATAIIIVHNHPSGDPTPSQQDIRLTRDLIEAGRHMKVTVHDHVIVGARAEQPEGAGADLMMRRCAALVSRSSPSDRQFCDELGRQSNSSIDPQRRRRLQAAQRSRAADGQPRPALDNVAIAASRTDRFGARAGHEFEIRTMRRIRCRQPSRSSADRIDW